MDRDTKLQEFMEIFEYKELTEVQQKVLEPSLNGKNLVVQSVTGTGKTHAFLFPALMDINKEDNDLQVLISSPTRELARQIYQMAKPICEKEEISLGLFVGGDDIEKSRKKLSKGNPMVVIGTPGRISQLSVDDKLLHVYHARRVIIDEADMTLDSGFLPLIDKSIAVCGNDCSFQVYSATIPEAIQPFLKKYLSNPEFIVINNKDLTPLNITHYFLKTKYRDKTILIREVMKAINPYLAIIYCNTKESVMTLYNSLKTMKGVCYLHGDMEPSKRKKTMKDIRDMQYTYIISTDLTSRGLDIPGISHIINYELPRDTEFYVHRTGRTGRMFQDGVSISFYDLEDDSYLDKLEEKGLDTEYVEIKDNQIVKSKIRNARDRKDFFKSKINVEAEKTLRFKRTVSKKVKPNYKKKFQSKVEEEKRKIIKKRMRKGLTK